MRRSPTQPCLFACTALLAMAGALVASEPDKNKPAAASGASLKVTATPLGKATYKDKDRVVFGPDGRRVVVVRQLPDSQTVFVDGEESKKTYDMVLDVFFSSDGKRVAYTAKRDDGKLVAVIDGTEGKGFDVLEPPQFSADGSRVGYVGRLGGISTAVIDGVEGKADLAGLRDLVFSPDGKHAAYVGFRMNPSLGNEEVVVVDGKEGKAYPQVGNLFYSPDGKLLYGAQLAPQLGKVRESRVFVDGTPEKGAFDEVQAFQSKLLTGPDGTHLAYWARRGRKELVVLDGREDKTYDHVIPESLQFSPDGRLAYVAQQGDKSLAVIDGNDGAEYAGPINNLQFSGDGSRFAYLTGIFGKVCCVTDKGEDKRYTTVSTPVLGKGGAHVVYTAFHADLTFTVVLDGKDLGEPYNDVEPNDLIFSPDGKRLAYLAFGGKPNPTWKAVVDGAEQKAPENSQPFHGTLVFSPDGRHTAYAVLQMGVGAKVPSLLIVVDGVPSKPLGELLGPAAGSKPTFDGPNKLHLTAGQDGKVVRVDVEIGEK